MAVKKCLGACVICLLLLIAVTIIVIIIGSTIAWITLHSPKLPRFAIKDATVLSFNVTSNPPNLLTSNFQINFTSSNPNHKTEIYYDQLFVYATYQSQHITFATSIPPTYQGHDEVSVLSLFVGGKSVPISSSNALSLLSQEQTHGAVNVSVQIDGLIRWKVGPFTRIFNIYVRCPSSINLVNRVTGVVVGGKGVKYKLCSVSV